MSRVVHCALAVAAICLACSAALANNPDELQARIAGQVVFVPVLLNGRGPYPFIVDTGATETIVTPATAKAAGMPILSSPGAQKKGVAGTLMAGHAGLTNLPVFVFDPPQALSLRLDEGINYGGILGYTFLSRFVTTIDYPHHIVRFQAAAGTPSPAPGAITIPFRLVDHLIHVSGSVNRSAPLTFLLDTGSAELLLTPQAAEPLQLQSSPLPSFPGARLARISQINLGSASVTQVDAIIHQLPGARVAGTTCDGIVGYPFLSNFAVSIRYDRATISLDPGR